MLKLREIEMSDYIFILAYYRLNSSDLAFARVLVQAESEDDAYIKGYEKILNLCGVIRNKVNDWVIPISDIKKNVFPL
jgi:hypothetical protein